GGRPGPARVAPGRERHELVGEDHAGLSREARAVRFARATSVPLRCAWSRPHAHRLQMSVPSDVTWRDTTWNGSAVGHPQYGQRSGSVHRMHPASATKPVRSISRLLTRTYNLAACSTCVACTSFVWCTSWAR